MKVTIHHYTFLSDWTTVDPKEIDTDDYISFEFHYRGEKSWHLVGVQKTKCLDGYYREEFGHGLVESEVAETYFKLKDKVTEILDYHNHGKGIDEFIRLIKKYEAKNALKQVNNE
jgi:hypothetical protein